MLLRMVVIFSVMCKRGTFWAGTIKHALSYMSWERNEKNSALLYRPFLRVGDRGPPGTELNAIPSLDIMVPITETSQPLILPLGFLLLNF